MTNDLILHTNFKLQLSTKKKLIFQTIYESGDTNLATTMLTPPVVQ
jgi:hypothetical protein